MLTAEWEQKLTAIARGEGDPAAFMAGISDMARELVKTYSHISEEGQKLFAPEREAVGLCPRCGKPPLLPLRAVEGRPFLDLPQEGADKEDGRRPFEEGPHLRQGDVV